MESILTNIADFSAEYRDEPVTFSSNEVSTTIITGLTVEKTANKDYWINGPLTYTITVHNTTGYDLTGVIFRDYINSTIATFDDSFGVLVDGAPVVYTYTAEILSFNLPVIQEGATVTITFQVLQA